MQFAAGAPNVLVGSGTGEVRGSSHSQTKIDNFFKLRSSSINAITETDYWLRSQRGKKLMFVCCINQLNWYLPEIEFCSEKWRCWVRNCTCDRRHLKEGAQFCQLSPQPQLQPQSQPLNKNISTIAKAACLLGWNLSQFLNGSTVPRISFVFILPCLWNSICLNVFTGLLWKSLPKKFWLQLCNCIGQIMNGRGEICPSRHCRQQCQQCKFLQKQRNLQYKWNYKNDLNSIEWFNLVSVGIKFMLFM